MNQRFIFTAYTIFSFAGHPACRWALPFGAGAFSRACSHPEGLSPPGKSKKRAPLELERMVVSYSRHTVRFRWRFVSVCKRKAQAKYFQDFQMLPWSKAVPALVLQGRAWKQEGSSRLQKPSPPATRRAGEHSWRAHTTSHWSSPALVAGAGRPQPTKSHLVLRVGTGGWIPQGTELSSCSVPGSFQSQGLSPAVPLSPVPDLVIKTSFPVC